MRQFCRVRSYDIHRYLLDEFFNMTDEPVVIWDDFHDPSYDAFSMSQRQRTDQNALLPWTPWRESYAKGQLELFE